ncbi:MAG TPA: glycoside hydrolase family 3 C-terminal domain-containing protein, partial [Acidimicrobiales bacterium]
AEADVAIVVVGSTTEWETEGEDRSTMDLPGRQAELVSAVAVANPRTILVLNVGAPVTTGWSSEVGATLLAWLPGQEAGGALADVLFGDADPSGRLPTSFPVRATDNLADAGFPGVDGHLPYGEGLLLGYRHHDTDDVAPAFCFGHGLSYTTFAYADPELVTGADGRPAVRVIVTNLGSRAGRAVVQAYAEPSARSEGAPVQQLVGFESVEIAAGESTVVDLALDSRAWTHWSEETGGWAFETAPVAIHVASSSRDRHGSVTLDPATGPPRFAGE